MKSESVAALRDRWNRRAQENPLYYIAAGRQDWSEGEFLSSGEADVAQLVDPLLPSLARPASECTALDIGCGLGRLARPLAARFRQVLGIDISPAMVEQARSFAPPVPANIRFQVCDGSGAIPLEAGTVDFVFSYLVFQHVPSLDIVETYFREIARVLAPDGLAALQVSTVRRPLRERFQVRVAPSEKVPLVKRKVQIRLEPHSTMGVTLRPGECAHLVAGRGLRLESMSGGGTQYTWLIVRKPR